MNTTSRSCPDIGVWRGWLDHEFDRDEDATSLEEHLPGCPACQRLVADLRDDASDVRDILSVLAPSRMPTPSEIAAARERIDWRSAAASPMPVHRQELNPMRFPIRLSTPWRVAAGGLAAALVIALLVAFTPEGSSVAAAFLSQFRSQQVTAIEVGPQSQAEIVRTLNALGNLGTVQMPGGGPARPETVAGNAESQSRTVSLAEASRTVGFPLVVPDPSTLPAGVDKTPQVRVVPAQQMQFTFDKTKARAYYQSTGHPEMNVPDKFDGAKLMVSVPSAVLLEYGGKPDASSANRSTTALVVGQAGELVVDVQGNVSLAEMRDFLLSQPGLPTTVVAQLRQIQNWNATLPIPVPVDQVHWQTTTINGSQGLLLNDNSGVGSAAIWHANGHLIGVAGSVKANELRRFAEGLAVR